MNSRQTLMWVLISVFSTQSLAATPAELVAPGQVVIQVNGVVCSFCAYGAEKNLGKLDFLDKSAHGGDGVLVDIHTQRITLALQVDHVVDYAGISAAITKGGYDPVRYYLALTGMIETRGGEHQLVSQHSGQMYRLPDTAAVALLQNQLVLVRTELSAEQARAAVSGQALPLADIELTRLP